MVITMTVYRNFYMVWSVVSLVTAGRIKAYGSARASLTEGRRKSLYLPDPLGAGFSPRVAQTTKVAKEGRVELSDLETPLYVPQVIERLHLTEERTPSILPHSVREMMATTAPSPEPRTEPASLQEVLVTCSGTELTVRVQRDFYGFTPTSSELTLGRSCKSTGVHPSGDLLFTYPLTSCDFRQGKTPGYILYKYVLHYVPLPTNLPIRRAHGLNVDIQCHVKSIYHVHQLSVQPTWATPTRKTLRGLMPGYGIQTMSAGWAGPAPTNVFLLGQRVHFQAFALHLPPRGRLYVDRCYASVSGQSDASPKYYVIENFGCMVDSKINGSTSGFSPQRTNGTIDFALDAFQLISKSAAEVFLHCQLYVTTDEPSPTVKSCTYSHEERRWKEVSGRHWDCTCCDSQCLDSKARQSTYKGFLSSGPLMFTTKNPKPKTSFGLGSTEPNTSNPWDGYSQGNTEPEISNPLISFRQGDAEPETSNPWDSFSQGNTEHETSDPWVSFSHAEPKTSTHLDGFSQGNTKPETSDPWDSFSQGNIEPKTSNPWDSFSQENTEPETSYPWDSFSQGNTEPETSDPWVNFSNAKPKTGAPSNHFSHAEPKINNPLNSFRQGNTERETSDPWDGFSQWDTEPETSNPLNSFSQENAELEASSPWDRFTQGNIEPETSDPWDSFSQENTEPETSDPWDSFSQENTEPETSDPWDSFSQENTEPETSDPWVSFSHAKPKSSAPSNYFSHTEPKTSTHWDDFSQGNIEPETNKPSNSFSQGITEPETSDPWDSFSQDNTEPETSDPWVSFSHAKPKSSAPSNYFSHTEPKTSTHWDDFSQGNTEPETRAPWDSFSQGNIDPKTSDPWDGFSQGDTEPETGASWDGFRPGNAEPKTSDPWDGFNQGNTEPSFNLGKAVSFEARPEEAADKLEHYEDPEWQEDYVYEDHQYRGEGSHTPSPGRTLQAGEEGVGGKEAGSTFRKGMREVTGEEKATDLGKGPMFGVGEGTMFRPGEGMAEEEHLHYGLSSGIGEVVFLSGSD